MQTCRPNSWRVLWLAAACALLLGATAARAGEIIDRIVATVNNDVVLQSDLEEGLRFEALANGAGRYVFTAEQRGEELQRTVDRVLLRQQMRRSGFQRATETEIAAGVAEFRARIPGAQSDSGWMAALGAAGLTQHDVERRVARQIEIARFVDQRFRPGIRIDSSEVRRYYDDVLTPQLRDKGAAVPPLAQVSARIEEILVEKSIDEQLDSWLKSLRAESNVRILGENQVSLAAGDSQ